MAHPIEKKFRKSSRLYGALAIGFIGLIFLPELWSPNIFNRNFSIVMDVACFLGVWRIVQSGYLEIGSDSVVVRTVFKVLSEAQADPGCLTVNHTYAQARLV